MEIVFEMRFAYSEIYISISGTIQTPLYKILDI